MPGWGGAAWAWVARAEIQVDFARWLEREDFLGSKSLILLENILFTHFY